MLKISPKRSLAALLPNSWGLCQSSRIALRACILGKIIWFFQICYSSHLETHLEILRTLFILYMSSFSAWSQWQRLNQRAVSELSWTFAIWICLLIQFFSEKFLFSQWSMNPILTESLQRQITQYKKYSKNSSLYFCKKTVQIEEVRWLLYTVPQKNPELSFLFWKLCFFFFF